MPDLNTILLDRIERLEKQVDELRRRDRAMQALVLRDGVAAPTAVTGVAQIYVDTADGDLKVKFADGTTKTIATDT